MARMAGDAGNSDNTRLGRMTRQKEEWEKEARNLSCGVSHTMSALEHAIYERMPDPKGENEEFIRGLQYAIAAMKKNLECYFGRPGE